jgi:hypothetical protein
VWIGLVSYGLYLYHVPLYEFVNAQHVVTSEPARFVLRFAIVGIVAAASYVVIERPIRRGAMSRAQLQVLTPVAVGAVVVAILVSTAGARHATPVELQSTVFSRAKDAAPDDAARVLVAGDSLASSFVSTALPRFVGEGIGGVVEWASSCDVLGGSVAVSATPPPTPPVCSFEDSYRGALKSFDPDVSVLVLGPSVVFDRFVDGRRLDVGTRAFDAYLFSRLDAMRALLIGNGARFMITTVPCMTPPTTGKYAGLATIQRDPERVAAVNRAMHAYAEEHDVRIVDLGDRVCRNPEYLSAYGTGLSAAGQTAAWKLLATTAHEARS